MKNDDVAKSRLAAFLGEARLQYHKIAALLSKKQFFILISIPITFGVLGWLLWRQREVLLNYDWNIHIWPGLLAFGLYTIILFGTAWVWVWIMESMGGQKISFWKHFRAFCISALGKRLPGTVWYIAWRAKIYGPDGYSGRLVSLASGIEAVVSTLSAVIVSLIFAIPILLTDQLSLWGIIIISIISIILVQPGMIARLHKRLGLEDVQFKRKQLFLWTIVYIFIRLLVGTVFYLIINMLTPLSINNLPIIIGCQALVAALTMFLFFFPSNFGFAEVSLSLMLSSVLPSSIAVIVVILNRLLMMFFELIWTLIVVINELLVNKRT